MTNIGIINESMLENALIHYGNAWLKKEHPEYPKRVEHYASRGGSYYTTDDGKAVRDREIDRKALEIVKSVSEQMKIDLVLKASVVSYIANDLVNITDECVAEAEKLPK